MKKHDDGFFKWIFFNLFYPRLSVFQKAKVLQMALDFVVFKKNIKNKLFGKMEYVVIQVNKDWEFSYGEFTTTRVRTILFKEKREKIPFAYPKIYKGVQCTDETATPLKGGSYAIVNKIQDNIFIYNEYAKNQNHHKELRKQIVK